MATADAVVVCFNRRPTQAGKGAFRPKRDERPWTSPVHAFQPHLDERIVRWLAPSRRWIRGPFRIVLFLWPSPSKAVGQKIEC
jgi:hypothetical protein